MQATKLNPLAYEFVYDTKEDIKLLMTSDIHFDNPKCNRDLFFSHLNRAKKEGAKIFIIGDFFCMMQGKYDPRRSKKDIRPEHNKANYIDAVIDEAVDIMSPYADCIAFISEGNHETAILKAQETDVLARFVDKMNERNKTNIIKGGYRGWLILKKKIHKEKCIPYKIYYNHGFGGGGEMSHGILQHTRSNVYIENADAIWMGHVHSCYILPTKTEYLESNGGYNVKNRTVYNIRTSTYKEEFDGIAGGYHIEKGRPPKILGGIFCNIEHCRNEIKAHKFLPNYTIWE